MIGRSLHGLWLHVWAAADHRAGARDAEQGCCTRQAWPYVREQWRTSRHHLHAHAMMQGGLERQHLRPGWSCRKLDCCDPTWWAQATISPLLCVRIRLLCLQDSKPYMSRCPTQARAGRGTSLTVADISASVSSQQACQQPCCPAAWRFQGFLRAWKLSMVHLQRVGQRWPCGT